MKTHEMIEIMQAYEDDKAIQYAHKDGEVWYDVVCEPVWNWYHYNYRIKPEPKYVPYDSVLEVKKDKWVKDNATGMLYKITKVDPSDGSVCMAFDWYDLKQLFELYTYEDGNPCGKQVEA